MVKRYSRLCKKISWKGKRPKKKRKNYCGLQLTVSVVLPINRNYAQALQMYWFVHIGVTTEVNTWDAFSPGKLDQYLYPFYKKELEEGTIDYGKARELMECLWIKFNNQPAPQR